LSYYQCFNDIDCYHVNQEKICTGSQNKTYGSGATGSEISSHMSTKREHIERVPGFVPVWLADTGEAGHWEQIVII
jgi:hypothetical protein